jgi:hypothetical protein
LGVTYRRFLTVSMYFVLRALYFVLNILRHKQDINHEHNSYISIEHTQFSRS